MNAARHEGLSHLTALASSVSGHRRYLNPRRNQRSPKYVSAINMIDAPAIHHMRTAFGFVLQSSHSSQRGCHDAHGAFARARPAGTCADCFRISRSIVPPLIALPKAFAAILSILHSLPRANAGHRGSS